MTETPLIRTKCCHKNEYVQNYQRAQALHPGDEFTVTVGKTVDNQELTEEQLAAFCLDQGYEITAYEKAYLVPDTLQ